MSSLNRPSFLHPCRKNHEQQAFSIRATIPLKVALAFLRGIVYHPLLLMVPTRMYLFCNTWGAETE